MKRLWLSIVAVALGLAITGQASAANERGVTFGTLERPEAAAVQTRVQAYLKEVGQDQAQQLEAIWKQQDRSLSERVADAIALGNPAAAKLLAEARDPAAPAPVEIAPFFKDAKVPTFVRANVAMAYARALANKRVHEEALAVLKTFGPEQVVDPAAYLFYRAVSEHALLLKPEATKTIRRLQEEAQAIAPERYKTVALLMELDMHTWKDKDLASIARKMDNIERRLGHARGGPVTQKMEKEVVMRLDELIKEKENQKKQASSGGS